MTQSRRSKSATQLVNYCSLNMKILTSLTILIWITLLAFSVVFGLNTPQTKIFSTETGNLSVVTILMLTVGVFLFFSIAGFKQREKILSESRMSNRVINNVFGKDAAIVYRKTLRPTLLFMSVLLVWGVTGLIATFKTTQGSSAYLAAGMMLSGGLGILVAFLLSTKYPPQVC